MKVLKILNKSLFRLATQNMVKYSPLACPNRENLNMKSEKPPQDWNQWPQTSMKNTILSLVKWSNIAIILVSCKLCNEETREPNFKFSFKKFTEYYATLYCRLALKLFIGILPKDQYRV